MPSTPALLSVAAAAAASLAAVADAHICVFHPQQRGPGVPTNLTAGDPLCYRRTPYCGGVAAPAHPPKANTFVAGEVAQISFQQNLNHFWEASPGSLDVAVSYDLDPSGSDDSSSWQTLFSAGDIPTNDMVTQTNFSVGVRMPSRAADHVLLRFRYVSHNTGEIDPANNTESIFYNCADVRLVAGASAAESEAEVDPVAVTAPELTAEQKAATGCTTPTQWQAFAVETTATRGTIQHNIVHDRSRQIVSWARAGAIHEAGVEETLTTLSYYNQTIPGQPAATKPEYLLTNGGKACVLYGADPPYTWEYGPARNQVLQRTYTQGSATFQEWGSIDGLHQYVVREVSAGVCVPVVEYHPESALVFSDVQTGPAAIPAGAFDLPSVCKRPVLGHGIARKPLPQK